MSKHYKHRGHHVSNAIPAGERLTLEVLAIAEKAGAKAGYAVAKEELYRSIGNNNEILNEQETEELLAAAQRAGSAAALLAARKVIDKTLRSSFRSNAGPQLSADPETVAIQVSPKNYEEPLAQYSPSLGNFQAPRKKVEQHVLTITRIEQLSANMVRIIAAAPDLAGFRSNSALDQYVKVYVADPELGLVPPYDIHALRHRLPREQVPRSKSYTIRWVDTALNELSIDFVVHGDPGTVGHWAAHAKPGEPLVISPARSKSSPSLDAQYYVLAADEAGLPAIAKVLEALPAQAQGVALLEVAEATSMFDVKHPEGVVLSWLPRNQDPPGRSHVIAEALRTLPLPTAPIGVIAHAERSTVKAINHITKYWNLDKRATHISSYWTLREGRLGVNLPRHSTQLF